MKLVWTEDAQQDLVKLDSFLATFDLLMAERLINELIIATEQLEQFPDLGPKLENYEPRNVRRLIVAHYEIRYEIAPLNIYILRVWHEREDR